MSALTVGQRVTAYGETFTVATTTCCGHPSYCHLADSDGAEHCIPTDSIEPAQEEVS